VAGKTVEIARLGAFGGMQRGLARAFKSPCSARRPVPVNLCFDISPSRSSPNRTRFPCARGPASLGVFCTLRKRALSAAVKGNRRPTHPRCRSVFVIGEKLFEAFDTLRCKSDGGYVVEVQRGEGSRLPAPCPCRGVAPRVHRAAWRASDGEDATRCRHHQAARAIRLVWAQFNGVSFDSRDAG
jgi:hypothetical protein